MDESDASTPTGLEWEDLASTGPAPDPRFPRNIFVARAKIPGGWLVVAEKGPGTGLTFVPDPNHEWTAAPHRGR
jgi:hypothetical protein